MEGDVIHLQLAEGQSHDVKAFLKALPEVNKVERVPNEGFQELLLKGDSVDFSVWLGLGLITLLSYGLVGLIMRRRYTRIAQ